MAASGQTSAPVAACGILVVLGAPNSYNFIYSRFPSTAAVSGCLAAGCLVAVLLVAVGLGVAFATLFTGTTGFALLAAGFGAADFVAFGATLDLAFFGPTDVFAAAAALALLMAAISSGSPR